MLRSSSSGVAQEEYRPIGPASGWYKNYLQFEARMYICKNKLPIRIYLKSKLFDLLISVSEGAILLCHEGTP